MRALFLTDHLPLLVISLLPRSCKYFTRGGLCVTEGELIAAVPGCPIQMGIVSGPNGSVVVTSHFIFICTLHCVHAIRPAVNFSGDYECVGVDMNRVLCFPLPGLLNFWLQEHPQLCLVCSIEFSNQANDVCCCIHKFQKHSACIVLLARQISTS